VILPLRQVYLYLKLEIDLTRHRIFESVLNRLLSWAAASLEKSVNQPALPHVIIALNFTDLSSDESLWDPAKAKSHLMTAFTEVMEAKERFRDLARKWQRREKTIRSIEDLLGCYYSSVHVIRIPVKGRYMLIDEQIGKLYEMILLQCRLSHETKRRARMASNGDDLQMYLMAAFDHFARKLDVPFNFIDVAMRYHPIPQNFTGNIVQLAIAIKNHPDIHLTGEGTFKELGGFVALCIHLDTIRQGHKGKFAIEQMMLVWVW
jgi:hypothetical protein